MAVYTPMAEDDLARLLTGYDIGQAVALDGITEGVENTNYKLTTNRGEFILTIYEKRVDAADLPFFMDLMAHLSAGGYPCPTPIADKKGQVLQRHANKPLAIVSFLPGISHLIPSASQCYAAGAVLARLHLAAADLPLQLQRKNALGQAAWQPLFDRCRQSADRFIAGSSQTLAQWLGEIGDAWPKDLPTGVVHADLFPDNVLFTNGAITGVIDFYFACQDYFAYDLAVMLNAWCFDRPQDFNKEKSAALINGYASHRPLTKFESAALPILAKGAAMRFFLTRLYDWDNTPADAQVRRHDPMDYWHRLNAYTHISSLA